MNEQQHKDLGVLGLGSRSTAFYLERLNELFRQQFGGYGTCPLTLLNTNFNDINPFLPDQFATLEPVLSGYLAQFDDVKNVLIPNITLHETVDKLTAGGLVRKGLVDPVARCIDEIHSKGVNKICVFGSLYTMNSNWLIERFRQYGITVDVPDSTTQTILDEIRQRVYHRQELTQDLSLYTQLLEQSLQKMDVVIACTELSLITFNDSPQVFDMARIQLQAGFQASFPPPSVE